MKIRELFKPTGITQSIAGTTIFLDRENCRIVNKTKYDDSILLHLKREADGEEGHAYLRAQDQFKSIATELLNWAFTSESIVGLTLNELDNLETNLSLESIQGKLQLAKK